MAGPSSPAKTRAHFVGAIVFQPAEALDAFVRMAKAGTEFVYAEAPEPPRDQECWRKAGELARAGLVSTHERRRAGGGRQYFLLRTGRMLPRQVPPQDKVLKDRATATIFTELKRAANLGKPCPSDAELADKAGLNSRDQAQWRIRELVRVDLIESQLAYEGGVRTRVVTILASAHAGAAGGKSTALPKKWAAMREAAERELRTADEAKLKQMRDAGL